MRNQTLSRWYLLYFLLAGFAILTLFISLYMNHHVTSLHANTVAMNRDGADRLHFISD